MPLAFNHVIELLALVDGAVRKWCSPHPNWWSFWSSPSHWPPFSHCASLKLSRTALSDLTLTLPGDPSADVDHSLDAKPCSDCDASTIEQTGHGRQARDSLNGATRHLE
jgi:hypothetical protein